MKNPFSASNLALLLCVLLTCLWTYWGVMEMFHQGWYAPFQWLFYLLPAGVCLAFTLIGLTRPRFGGAHAHCSWTGRSGRQPCAVLPDKETPL